MIFSIKIILYILLINILHLNIAHAYLDPGTGSIIFQVIVGGIAAFMASILFYFRKFKIFFKNLFKKNKKKDENKI